MRGMESWERFWSWGRRDGGASWCYGFDYLAIGVRGIKTIMVFCFCISFGPIYIYIHNFGNALRCFKTSSQKGGINAAH